MEIIYAIPGLGTTKELYSKISVPNYELRVLEWPTPEINQTLKNYAHQFINQLTHDKPVTLLGVSFGGMLCAEIAESIPVNKVFLVSSCKNRTEFPILLKMLRIFPLYKFFSENTFRAIAKTKRKFIGFEKSFEPVFIDMINRMPENYFSYCIHGLINWERITNKTSPVQIHGTADRLLTHRTLRNYYAIKGGTHAMILSNAAEINAILNKELNERKGTS